MVVNALHPDMPGVRQPGWTGVTCPCLRYDFEHGGSIGVHKRRFRERKVEVVALRMTLRTGGLLGGPGWRGKLPLFDDDLYHQNERSVCLFAVGEPRCIDGFGTIWRDKKLFFCFSGFPFASLHVRSTNVRYGRTGGRGRAQERLHGIVILNRGWIWANRCIHFDIYLRRFGILLFWGLVLGHSAAPVCRLPYVA